MTRREPPVILLVEDDLDLLELYRETLEATYRVRTARSGEAALEAFDDAVDLVLLDRRMPEMSGDAVLEELRARDYRGPVAMVTAIEPAPDIVDMPFDDYLVKPVSSATLEAVVEALLRRTAYDDLLRELFASASKLSALEANYHPAELEASEEYHELETRVAALHDRAEATLGEMSPDEIGDLFQLLR